MRHLLFICCLFLISFSTNAQLISSDQNKSKSTFNDQTFIYLGVDVLNSFRDLNPNIDHLNTPLGERANEIPRWLTGYSVRVTVPIMKMLKVNTGLSFQQN